MTQDIYKPIPPPEPLPGTQPGWRYGGDMIGGRPRSYWEQHPEEYMQYIINQEAPNASMALRGWLADQGAAQSSLWNAYKQVYGGLAGVDERPMGDWLSAFMGGQSPSWGGTWSRGPAPGVGSPQERQQQFMRMLGANLMTGSQRAQDWRQSVNDPRNPYTALEVLLAGSGYAPAVASSLLGRARDIRQEYGGIGEGKGLPGSYAEWLWRRLAGPVR